MMIETVTEYRDKKKEQKKELMKWSKGDLADRLLFAYQTIGNYERKTDTIRAEARAEALQDAADRAIAWYQERQVVPTTFETRYMKELRAAITQEEE
jgi:hypothetical protein